MSITVVIPSIPPRAQMLNRALASLTGQPYDKVIVKLDEDGFGPSEMRNQGILEADTEWVAFLDDDDEFYPSHLHTLITHAESHGSDVVYPWYDIINSQGRVTNQQDPGWIAGQVGQHPNPAYRRKPRRSPFGVPFSEVDLRDHAYIPVTALVRRFALLDVGGFPKTNTPEWPHKTCEDHGLYLRLLDAGCTFEHVPVRTWRWHHHGKNTSGLPERWRSRARR